ncbi:sulfite exporter TauE/SafE family protein [Microbacterium sp. zg.Y909]|uniref:sulfite exporter TauE/SafE family protein n=1 Tax=Microbacterium sp. zg.Y909 TaxID=2969413 RepID=UPI00214CBE07|nr:sulfite exporter TauE/SafE family protein [Microbacterium sp. zg.Y909]MCR2827838.1 sulfite exporter TauE/SafE family protein [Microbacterium sp. zg.Y909]
MDWGAVVVLALAGTAAGAINAIAGGGSLVTFPALLALGYPPVIANVTNTVAALPGYVGGAWGYRRELAGQRRRIIALSIVTVIGALVGSTLLLAGDESTFTAVVPWLVLASTLLLAAQPYLSALVARRTEAAAASTPRAEPLRWAGVGQLGVAVYGGYFNAGLGIMMLGVLGVALRESLQRLNALKSVLSVVASAVSLVFFAVFAEVSWPAAGIMAVSGLLGGWLGAAVGRRLPVPVLRWSVVVFGLAVFVALLVDAG